ncbi:hypothetical protein F4804DRAFT_330286 [Jackrogersella minutella]|nr:hypothetical protein F4804DRAFT_330286 [Jackrogersella minutella]
METGRLSPRLVAGIQWAGNGLLTYRDPTFHDMSQPSPRHTDSSNYNELRYQDEYYHVGQHNLPARHGADEYISPRADPFDTNEGERPPQVYQVRQPQPQHDAESELDRTTVWVREQGDYEDTEDDEDCEIQTRLQREAVDEDPLLDRFQRLRGQPLSPQVPRTSTPPASPFTPYTKHATHNGESLTRQHTAPSALVQHRHHQNRAAHISMVDEITGMPLEFRGGSEVSTTVTGTGASTHRRHHRHRPSGKSSGSKKSSLNFLAHLARNI